MSGELPVTKHRDKRRGFKFRDLRWPVQVAMLALFVWMATELGRTDPRQAFWLMADPLVTLVTAISTHALFEGVYLVLIILLPTILIGRFFCGWICPLGTILDLADRFIWKRRNSPPGDIQRPRAIWKQLILATVVGSAVIGVSAGLIFDPLVLMMRTTELVLVPLATWTGYGAIHAMRLIPGQATLSWPLVEDPPLYGWMTATALVFVGIIWLSRVERRFWCRNLCPLGALLGWLSRFGLMKRWVDSECTSCIRCARDCPMGAIPSDFGETVKGECIQCLRCQEACPQHGVRFGLKGHHDTPAFLPERRQAIAAIAGGIGIGLMGKASTDATPVPATFIRPPGSLPEDEFLGNCTRCMACVQVCPTHGLQPSGFEAGWERTWTPRLIAQIGGCEEPCFACGQVCPTGAIRNLPHAEKSFARMGTARVIRERCIAWEELKPCLVCDEVCPYDAIDFLTITDHKGTQRRPVVIEDKCMGCGLCEEACPVQDARAIIVEHYAQERRSTGSYVTKKKKRLREVGDDHGTDYLREYRTTAPSSGSGGTSEGDDRGAYY